ncbi:hypothetical protein [Anaplasma platys]|nr:hypothetical protein [Anaplasma platys]
MAKLALTADLLAAVLRVVLRDMEAVEGIYVVEGRVVVLLEVMGLAP